MGDALYSCSLRAHFNAKCGFISLNYCWMVIISQSHFLYIFSFRNVSEFGTSLGRMWFTFNVKWFNRELKWQGSFKVLMCLEMVFRIKLIWLEPLILRLCWIVEVLLRKVLINKQSSSKLLSIHSCFWNSGSHFFHASHRSLNFTLFKRLTSCKSPSKGTLNNGIYCSTEIFTHLHWCLHRMWGLHPSDHLWIKEEDRKEKG